MIEAIPFKNPELILFWENFSRHQEFNGPAFVELQQNTDDETAVRILARFTENLKEAAIEIELALKGSDSLRVSKAAHKIAGTCELLGFKEYGLRAKSLSARLKSNTAFSEISYEISGFMNETIDLFAQIQSACPNLKSYL